MKIEKRIILTEDELKGLIEEYLNDQGHEVVHVDIYHDGAIAVVIEHPPFNIGDKVITHTDQKGVIVDYADPPYDWLVEIDDEEYELKDQELTHVK